MLKVPKKHFKIDKNLLDVFNKYNKAYFGGRLKTPNNLEYRYRRINGKIVAGLTEEYESGHIAISINPDYKKHDWAMRITMLHEMAHLVAPDQGDELTHGIRWGSEIVRIFNLGAYDDLL